MTVRGEIERKHDFPNDATELRFWDLPEDIQIKLYKAFGDRVEHFVLRPMASTVVVRSLYEFYMNPHQPVNFTDKVFLAKPPEGAEADNIFCVELALDKVRGWMPPAGIPIKKIFKPKTIEDFERAKFRNLGKRQVAETEFIREKSGRLLTNEELIAGYVGMMQAWHQVDDELRKTRKTYKRIKPSSSKGAIVIGEALSCQRDSDGLYEIYAAALPFSP